MTLVHLIHDARGYVHRWHACGPTFTCNPLRAAKFPTREKAEAVVRRHRAALDSARAVTLGAMAA